MRILRSLFVAALTGAVATSALVAQETEQEAICRTETCGVLLDWGSGGVPSGIDRRYGRLGDFEERLLRGLVEAGYSFNQTPGVDAFSVRLRPRVESAICDQVRGLNPDNSCNMITEVRTDFLNADDSMDLPGNLRIRNRCGSGELMDIEKFTDYVVAMLDYTFARDKDRKRPTAKC